MEDFLTEILLVKNLQKQIPSHALYIAGSAQHKTKLSIQILFKFIQSFYQKAQQYYFSQTQIQQIQFLIFKGEIGTAKEFLEYQIKSGPSIHQLQYETLKLIQELKCEIPVLQHQNSLLCSLCKGPIQLSDCFMPESCNHFYHTVCIREVVGKQQNLLTFKCPSLECSVIFNQFDIRSIDGKLVQKFHQQALQKLIASGVMGKPITCPNCSEKLAADGSKITCPRCHHYICSDCESLEIKCRCDVKCPNCQLRGERGPNVCCKGCSTIYCGNCSNVLNNCICQVNRVYGCCNDIKVF